MNTPKDLLIALKQADLPCSRQWFYKEVNIGRLIPPRLPSRRMVFTNKQIEEIVKAYSIGSKGRWHYKKERS